MSDKDLCERKAGQGRMIDGLDSLAAVSVPVSLLEVLLQGRGLICHSDQIW